MLSYLRFTGKIDQASNGQDALDKVMLSERKNFNGSNYDIIFLDLNMPILNGYEACLKIKEFYKDSSIRKNVVKNAVESK